MAGVCRPARDVGGDLYDFGDLDGKIGISVGDVSGKGMSAAVHMTLTLGLLAAAAEGRDDPAEIIGDVNIDLLSKTPRGVFVTMFFGVLDPARRFLRFVRAGHNPLVLRRGRDGDTVVLCPKGLALGLVGEPLFSANLEIGEVQLEPGDSIYITSDGVTEAMNRHQEEYGEDRLSAAVEASGGLDAAAARDAILADLDAFVGEAPVHDDVTLVVLRVEDEQ